MAITTALFGPNDRMPHFAAGEWQWLRLVGDGTQVVVQAGMGVLARVILNVAGTRAAFHDVVGGQTADATNLIVNLPINTLAVGEFDIGAPFDDGLTVITTGAASDLTIFFSGRASYVSARTFGA